MPMMDRLRDIPGSPKILLLGSGGLSIGQAGEFDYSGTQAVNALLEENCQVIIINPNIATVQTNPRKNTQVYLYPVEWHWVEKIIAKENPDAIIAGFGGQTALNCLMELDQRGILKKHQIQNLGTTVDVLRMTEDRDLFAKKMNEIKIPIPPSMAANTVAEALKGAQTIGYPVIVRAAYALGGLGSGFANNDQELLALAEPALHSSPQVLVERSLKGWKELEYEVMRDHQGNIITICNMENFDPLGIHTGDSIVVCPSQSLSDDEYQLLRNASLMIAKEVGIVGECNVQFALNPESLEFYVIEMNARLSRSSALASKASGYPIAFIAAKVVLGFDLLELKNPVTGVTSAFFEPALDYVTIKFPRWDLTKFQGASRSLGSTMKSVGEIMSIGRSFPEAIQKAMRMITEQGAGLSCAILKASADELRELLRTPTDQRFLAVVEALRNDFAVDEIHELTKIDRWFLTQIAFITKLEGEITDFFTTAQPISSSDNLLKVFEKHLFELTDVQLRTWKRSGFGDEQITSLALKALNPAQSPFESSVQQGSLLLRDLRKKLKVIPVIKKIDTTAAEHPSHSNYMYFTYNGTHHDPLAIDPKKTSALILGGGAYRIGTSVEFDWCAVSCSQTLAESGWRSIMINCNPETVSTDYDSSDHLYFEEINLERILDICDIENPQGVIASMGGQLPNRLALPLSHAGIKLLGHQASTIEHAENRKLFSALLDKLNIAQPRWTSASRPEQVNAFIDEIGFPVLIRPSFVLSGAAMNVAFDHISLNKCLKMAADISDEHPVVISQFIEGGREIELDGISQNGQILTAIVSEHIENAGVHSGDATTVVPAQNLYVETIRKVRKAGRAIAQALSLNGPFNMQFIAKSGEIMVIECNARAARSFPFVSKTVGFDLARAATKVMVGKQPLVTRLHEDDLPHVGTKAAMFSFKRLGEVDPVLGVEMASTGEVGCIAESFAESIMLALEAAGVKTPKKGVLVSSGPERDKFKFLAVAQLLVDLNLPLYATAGTAKHLKDHGIACQQISWPGQDHDCLEAIREHLVDMVINITKNHNPQELAHGRKIRITAVRYGCSLFTNIEKATAFIRAINHRPDLIQDHIPSSLLEFKNQ
jgi:carbamoyl-phosphate synthase large subunit